MSKCGRSARLFPSDGRFPIAAQSPLLTSELEWCGAGQYRDSVVSYLCIKEAAGVNNFLKLLKTWLMRAGFMEIDWMIGGFVSIIPVTLTLTAKLRVDG